TTNIVEAGFDNPSAVLSFLAENAPDLAIGFAYGAPGTLATVGAEMLSIFDKGIEEYRKANNGAMPPADEVSRIAAWTGTHGLAEFLSERAVVTGAAPIGQSLSAAGKVAAGAATKAVDTVAKEGFKASLKAAGAASKDLVDLVAPLTRMVGAGAVGG